MSLTDAPQFTLDQIKAHIDFPFADWETNDLSFLLSELYWAEIVSDVLGGVVENWQPIYETDRDGNPILTLTNLEFRRGLRIIQHINDDEKPLYPQANGPEAFYPFYVFRNIAKVTEEEMEIEELVLLAIPSEQSEELARKFITLHCVDKISADVLESTIADFEKQFEM